MEWGTMIDFLMWAGGLIGSGIFALIGWIFGKVFKQIEELQHKNDLIVKGLSEYKLTSAKDVHGLQKSIDAHKLHASERFATKLEVRDMSDRIMLKLDNIDNKLDGKADKQ
jgi:hypothetical protein